MIIARILILTAILTAALGYMIWDRMSVLGSSQIVTLKTAPVDPSDMFRGDYVTLRYEISRLEPATLDGDDQFYAQLPVYVTLVETNGVWNAVAVNKAPPPSPKGVVIRGMVDNLTYGSGANSPPPGLNVSYGIESFFVPQGTGTAIEAARQKGEVTVDVAIDTQGRAAIKALRQQSDVIYVEGFL